MGLLDRFYAVAEPAMGLLSRTVAEPVAGWNGILSGGSKQAVDGARNALTYQPRTAAGKAGQNALANALLGVKTAMVDSNPPVKAVAEGYHDLADMAGQYNPLLGALLDTFPVAASSLLAPEARGAFASAGRSLAPAAGQMAESYMFKTGGALPMLPPDVFKALVEKQRSGEALTIAEKVALQNHRSAALSGEKPQPPSTSGMRQ